MELMVPVRQYSTSMCELDDNHELITRLDWPCYDVFAFDGKGKEVIRIVPNHLVRTVIEEIKDRNPNVGVIGVAEIGINETDAELLALTGVGAH